MITMDQAAAQLNGNQYGKEGSKELFLQMKEAGLVAVFGASDDLMEFRGAINDEAGVGYAVAIDADGIIQSECAEGDDCPYFKRLLKNAHTITANDNSGGFQFTYDTTFPHVTFIIMEDTDRYCRGVVFNVKDL